MTTEAPDAYAEYAARVYGTAAPKKPAPSRRRKRLWYLASAAFLLLTIVVCVGYWSLASRGVTCTQHTLVGKGVYKCTQWTDSTP